MTRKDGMALSPLAGLTNASSILAVNALRNPGLPAVTERNGRSVTYAQLAARSGRLASALLDAGLQPGDRVAAWMGDSVYYVELLFAAASSGMVLVPVNARLTPREVSYILASAEPRLLFVDATTAPQVPEIEPGGYSVVWAEAGLPGPARAAAVGATVAIEDVMARARPRDLPPVPPSSPLLIGYTSGTTGSPKGVVMTHGSMRAGADVSLVALRIPHYGRAAYTGSFSFSALFAGHLLPHLLVGGHVILMGKWDVPDLRQVAEKWRPTFAFLPTPKLEEFRESLAACPESWRSLITVVQGGSSASSGLLEEISARMPGVFVRGWGMTENSGVMLTVTSAIDPETPAKDGGYTTVGRANIDTLIRTEIPQPESGDGIGELVVSTRSLMAGYWNDEQATSAVLRDGWYYTGDLGRVAADGQVYVTDRRHDLIVSGGMNVYPSEVESWIREHPGVAECVVVGIPHPRWGRAVAAAVVPATSALTSDDVIGWVRSGLASYKKPTLVDIRGAIPRDDRGKIDRHRLSTELATLSKA